MTKLIEMTHHKYISETQPSSYKGQWNDYNCNDAAEPDQPWNYICKMAAIVPTTTTSPSMDSTIETILIASAGVFLLLLVSCTVVVCLRLARRQKVGQSTENGSIQLSEMCACFETRKLLYAIYFSNNWNVDSDRVQIDWTAELGSGSSGAFVYRGVLNGDAPLLNIIKSRNNIIRNMDTLHDCPVAIKVLPSTATHAMRQDFLEEINLLKVICSHRNSRKTLFQSLDDHHHIAGIIASVLNDPQVCLLMEYCKHGDLLHFIRDYQNEFIDVCFTVFIFIENFK
jgi:hypothetical protein